MGVEEDSRYRSIPSPIANLFTGHKRPALRDVAPPSPILSPVQDNDDDGEVVKLFDHSCPPPKGFKQTRSTMSRCRQNINFIKQMEDDAKNGNGSHSLARSSILGQVPPCDIMNLPEGKISVFRPTSAIKYLREKPASSARQTIYPPASQQLKEKDGSLLVGTKVSTLKQTVGDGSQSRQTKHVRENIANVHHVTWGQPSLPADQRLSIKSTKQTIVRKSDNTDRNLPTNNSEEKEHNRPCHVAFSSGDGYYSDEFGTTSPIVETLPVIDLQSLKLGIVNRPHSAIVTASSIKEKTTSRLRRQVASAAETRHVANSLANVRQQSYSNYYAYGPQNSELPITRLGQFASHHENCHRDKKHLSHTEDSFAAVKRAQIRAQSAFISRRKDEKNELFPVNKSGHNWTADKASQRNGHVTIRTHWRPASSK